MRASRRLAVSVQSKILSEPLLVQQKTHAWVYSYCQGLLYMFERNTIIKALKVVMSQMPGKSVPLLAGLIHRLLTAGHITRVHL